MAEATDSHMSAPLLEKSSAHFTSATIEEITDSDVRSASAQQSAMSLANYISEKKLDFNNIDARQLLMSSANYTSTTKLDFDNIGAQQSGMSSANYTSAMKFDFDNIGAQQSGMSSANYTSAMKLDFDNIGIQQSAMSSANYTSGTIPGVMPMSPVEITQHPRSLHSSQQVENELTPDWNIMIQNLLPDCCRVPTILRDLKKEAYTPKVVSIGPFHHGNERLQEMEMFKPTMFNRFTQRAGLSWKDLVPFVKHLEPNVRASYPMTINLISKQKLVEVILLDAGFIIELFIMSHEYRTKKGGNNDAVLMQTWLGNSVLFDLLLLENQLPFFFIEELFNEAFSHQDLHDSLSSFLKLTYEYFGRLCKQQLDLNPDIKHFTDLLRLFYLQGREPERKQIQENGSHILSYNANALQEAGVKLQEAGVKLRDDHKSKRLLDLKFLGHTLEIPQIVVDDNTELLFRNMIALEQCHYHDATYITDYALLLDWLIDTDKDVDLLIHKKIIKSYLGDTKNVALLINGLSDNVVQCNFNSDFVKICEGLNDYCGNSRHKLKTTLRHDYCRTPWQTVASIAAIVVVFLTIVQTVFSILQVVN